MLHGKSIHLFAMKLGKSIRILTQSACILHHGQSKCGISVNLVSFFSSIVGASMMTQHVQIVWMIYVIVPIVTTPVFDFLGEEEPEYIHVGTRYHPLGKNSRIVVDGANQSQIVMQLKCTNGLIHPSLGMESNIVSALEKVITAVVVCRVIQPIPHFGEVSFWNAFHGNKGACDLFHDRKEARDLVALSCLSPYCIVYIIPNVNMSVQGFCFWLGCIRVCRGIRVQIGTQCEIVQVGFLPCLPWSILGRSWNEQCKFHIK